MLRTSVPIDDLNRKACLFFSTAFREKVYKLGKLIIVCSHARGMSIMVKDQEFIDSHVHIDFEKIESELELYLKEANEKNITEFTVTDHIILPNIPVYDYIIKGGKVFLKDLSSLKCSLTTADIKRYVMTIKGKEASNIRLGAEIDYNEYCEDKIKDFLALHPFDIVLGSLHFLDGYCISRKREMKSYSEKLPAVDIYKKYFTKMRKLAHSRIFDILSHVDLVRKHSEPVKFDDYSEEASILINDLLENDTGIEVNTSGYAFMNDSYPSLEFLDLCKKRGLDKITIGSDAHSVARLGENLEKAVEKLKSVGYSRIVKFKKRKPEYVSL